MGRKKSLTPISILYSFEDNFLGNKRSGKEALFSAQGFIFSQFISKGGITMKK